MSTAARRLPDFLIGGAARSGTTWLYHLLARHPQVYMARPVRPEPKYFLVDDLYARGLDYYAATWFADVPRGRLAGEKTTYYLESAPARDRIRRDLPGVRLIFLLRDPVARAYSNYLWSKQNGLEAEDFATALRLEPRREACRPAVLRFVRPHAYFSRGLYADLLQPFLDVFGRANVLCLRFEDIRLRPALLAARLGEFLGIAPRPEDAVALGVINESDKGNARTLAPALWRDLAARYEDPNRRLAALLGWDYPIWDDPHASPPGPRHD
jgi:hypothetical protein